MSKAHGNGRNAKGRFTRGNPGGPGRPKGSPNRTSKQVADDILAALEAKGGLDYLAKLDDRLYVRLLSRLLPTSISANVEMTHGFADDRLKDVPDDELERMVHAQGERVVIIGGDRHFYFEDAQTPFEIAVPRLALGEIEAALSDADAKRVDPTAVHCLEDTADALERNLPLLPAFTERARAALAKYAKGRGGK